MKYIPLAKCYHDPKFNYEAEYKDRFNAESTIHFDFQIHGNEAFFFMAPEISDLITAIHQTNKKYSQFESEIPVLDTAIKTCLFQEIKMTNEIEGIHLTYRELQEAYAQVEHSNSRLVGEMREYWKLSHGTNSSFPKNSDEIRAIYDNLLYEDVLRMDPENRLDGKLFRKEPVYIDDGNGTKHTGIQTEREIIRILDASIQILDQEDIDPLVYAALFHFIIGYIHPFYDGNGRVARYLSQIKLAEVLNIVGVLNLSFAIGQDRAKYYKAFLECEKFWNTGDLTPFVIQFLKFINIAMENGLQIIEEFHYTLNWKP